MNKQHQTKYFILFTFLVIAGLLLTACGKNAEQPDYVTVLSAEPTDSIDAMYTAAAETIYVEMTQTELAKPTETPVPPTATLIPTETLTSTMVPTSTTAYVYVAPVVYPTSTPGTVTVTSTATTAATASEYACSLSSQSISDYTEFAPGEDFDASWTVTNTGSEDWDASQIDYRYVSGTETYKYNSVYDFSSSVESGDSITIVVDMVAPSSEASYESYWGVFYSSTNLCSLPLRITVVDE